MGPNLTGKKEAIGRSQDPAVGRSLEKHPDLDPVFDDLTRAKSAKVLKEHLETRVL